MEISGKTKLQVPGSGQLRRFPDLLSHQAEILRDKRKMRHISTHWAVLQPLLAASSHPPDWRDFVQVSGIPLYIYLVLSVGS